MDNMRLRFAPSPTGALHIGGVRTALYNYLLAKKHNGTFILRIEDTDQTRYVPGAEQYILDTLAWCGIMPTEGPGIGGDYGPYRQSERKDLYGQYAQKLIDDGNAYYAFDTPEELNAMREKLQETKQVFRYDSSTRMQMKNSLTLPKEEVEELLKTGKYTIRLKIPTGESVTINDLVRGEVTFKSDELDDKVMLKGDGMPTYHLANIVDDHLMKITHVIRGEEWLPSTAHHVYLYRFMGWEDTMPSFAHLPLILKPSGKGKLSKRDGKKFGFPVFPLAWEANNEEDSFTGFREDGFLPEALLNFLAFLGWNPGTEQEIFSLEELVDAFEVEKIGKSGARFDNVKANWFNQQYIMAKSNEELVVLIQPYLTGMNYVGDEEYLKSFVGLMKERVTFLPDFVKVGFYFFEPAKVYDEKMIRKKWKSERKELFQLLASSISDTNPFEKEHIEHTIKSFINDNELGFGDVFPILRIAMSGTTKGPDLFSMMALLGKEKVLTRLNTGYAAFDNIKSASIT